MTIGDRDGSPRASGSTLAAASALLLLTLVASACVTVTGPAGQTLAPTAVPFEGPPTQAPLATPTPTPTPEPTPEPVEAEVLGFLPNWLLEDAALAIDSDILTIVALHGVEASGNGRLVSQKPSGDVPPGWRVLQSDAFRELQGELQADGVKVVLVVQRFGWREGPLRRTESLLTDPQDRRRLARQIRRIVEEHGLDGVNLDFEPMPGSLSDEYVELVREVRAALDALDEDLHLSVDVVSGLDGYDLAALTADDAADVAVIMGYNYRGDGAAIAGSAAPLRDPGTRDLATSVEEALVQVPPEKLILALPWYGKAWSTESDEVRSATRRGRDIDGSAEPAYAAAVRFATRHGRRYQPDQVSAWTAYPHRQCASCTPVWRQLWYEDPDSFGAKIDHALGQGLAGVGIWALGHEAGREDLWWTLRHRLDRIRDEAPPNGSASLDREQVVGEHDGLDVVEGSASLRLFASDDAEGSGLAFVRIGLDGDGQLAANGRLATGRTYPAAERIEVPLGDPELGGSAEDGPRAIHVQWRDIAGNWSKPLVIDAWVENPVAAPTPEDL